MTTQTIFQIRAAIPPSTIENHVAPELLPIWSVIQMDITTELDPQTLLQATRTIEHELEVAVPADEAYRSMVELLTHFVGADEMPITARVEEYLNRRAR